MKHVLVALAACSCSAPPAAPALKNQASGDRPTLQKFEVMVLEELSDCTKPHHITISIDGEPKGTVAIACRPQPKQTPKNGLVVTTTGEPHLFTMPAISIAPGHHRIAIRDAQTGLVDEQTGEFPLYGFLGQDAKPGTEPLADVIVGIVHVDWIRVQMSVKANLIFL